MILFFSATGNTEYIARCLAEALGDPEAVSLNEYTRLEKKLEVRSERPYVILSPVYISTIPEVVQEVLKTAQFSGNRKAYFVMTCAGDKSASAYFAAKICRQAGLRYMGTAHLTMPQDYLIYFKVKEPEENRRIVAAAEKKLPALTEQICREEPFAETRVGKLHVSVIRPVSVLFQRYFIDPAKFTVSQACVSCGRCAKVCPLGNIRMQEGKPVWGKHCIHCTACINRCPRKAIEYGTKTAGKKRYSAPVYKKNA